MALTVGSVAPIKPRPQSGGNSQSWNDTVEMHLANAQTVAAGDIIDLSTNSATVANTAATGALLLGVAMDAATSSASATIDEVVTIAIAWCGRMFEGSFVTNATTDITPTDLTYLHTAYDTVEVPAAYGAFPAIAQDDTTGPCAMPMAYAIQQLAGAKMVLSSTVNPRVVFTFTDSVFATPVS